MLFIKIFKKWVYDNQNINFLKNKNCQKMYSQNILQNLFSEKKT